MLSVYGAVFSFILRREREKEEEREKRERNRKKIYAMFERQKKDEIKEKNMQYRCYFNLFC